MTAIPARMAWTALSGSRTGSVHVRDELPLQDAVRTWCDGDRAIAAVADGHGHHVHFRSDTGAGLATDAAIDEVARRLPELTAAPDAEATTKIASEVAAAIVATWVRSVERHVADHPFAPGDHAAADPLIAYGTTLLASAVCGEHVVFWQIGDGDSVLVGPDDVASQPLPEDPQLDGPFTTSLCQRDPLSSLRTAVVPAAEVRLVFLCTDGFGRPQADPDWWRQTGTQLAGFGREHGWDWVAQQLPGWLEEPAQVGGDDTTMAILATVTVDSPAAD